MRGSPIGYSILWSNNYKIVSCANTMKNNAMARKDMTLHLQNTTEDIIIE